MSQDVSEETLNAWKVKYADLYAAIQRAQSGQELNKLIRSIIKQYDADELPYAACDGAIVAFKEERKEAFAASQIVTRSAADAKIERMSSIRQSDGKRRARRWS